MAANLTGLDTLALSKVDVTQVQNSGQNTPHLLHSSIREGQSLEGELNSTEVLHIVNGVDLSAATALEIVIGIGVTSQEKALQLIVGKASKQLIKDMEAALASTALHDT